MATFSFDIVSEYDKSEMDNVFAQVQREIANRYDFKGTPAGLEWLSDKTGFKITGSNEWQIDQLLDIVRKKLAARDQSSKSLDLSQSPVESNMKATKDIPFKEGLDQDKAKRITKLLKDRFPKAKTQIQGEAVRVTSGSKDELQTVMQMLKQQDFDFTVEFTNYR